MIPNSERKLTSTISALIILLGISFAYFIVHPPISFLQLNRIAMILKDIFITFLLFSSAGAIGTRIMPELKAPSLSRLSLRVALGLAVLAIAVLISASLLGLNQIVAWMAMILVLILLRKELRLCFADFKSFSRIWQIGANFEKGVMLLSGLIFLLALLNALAPALKFDALVYHLTLPNLYLEAARIYYVEAIAHWGFPQLPHMLSTIALTLGLLRPALIGWAMGALAVIGIADHLSERMGSRVAWLAIASLLVGSSLASSLAWAYVDWPSILMAWSMIFFLDNWIETQQAKSLTLAAIFAGLVFGVKYTAGLLAPLAALAVFYRSGKGKSLASAAKFLAIAFLSASPWLLRNFLASGNPFYPLLFTGGAMDQLRLAFYQGFPAQGNWLDLLFLPLRATLWGLEDGRYAAAPGFEASIGPLLLVFSIFAWIKRKELKEAQQRLLSLAAIISVGTLIVWALAGRFSGHLIRTHLYYSAFPAFAILASFGFLALEKLRIRRFLPIFVIAILALNLLQLTSATIKADTLKVVIGDLSEQAYLENNLGLHALVMHSIQQDLPSNANVLMLWEARSYYCAVQCDPDEIIDRWSHDLASFGSPEKVLAAWKSQSYTHILYYREAAQFVASDSRNFHPLEIAKLETLLSDLPITKDFNQAYTIYDLQP